MRDVAAFFRSALSVISMILLSSQTFIAHLNKRDLEQALVALPKPEEQRLIVDTQRSLTQLKYAIDEFGSEMALNPTSSSSIQKQLNTMLDAIGGLTDTDKVLALVREGESKHIEFKETLSLDVKKRTREKYAGRHGASQSGRPRDRRGAAHLLRPTPAGAMRCTRASRTPSTRSAATRTRSTRCRRAPSSWPPTP